MTLVKVGPRMLEKGYVVEEDLGDCNDVSTGTVGRDVRVHIWSFGFLSVNFCELGPPPVISETHLRRKEEQRIETLERSSKRVLERTSKTPYSVRQQCHLRLSFVETERNKERGSENNTRII